jgi:hypothetical protein
MNIRPVPGSPKPSYHRLHQHSLLLSMVVEAALPKKQPKKTRRLRPQKPSSAQPLGAVLHRYHFKVRDGKIVLISVNQLIEKR